MFRTRIYYHAKPLLPWPVRMAVRRWFAVRTRRQAAAVWPIRPGSEKPPEGWPGWPDGKQFALVLTHDVEGQSGLDKVRQLAQFEMQLGFQSAFNFIPEGEYHIPPELREELSRNGLEVGVHDLYHDGRLFSSRTVFRERALKINKYLEAWGAVGFRSGFMLNELDWLHDLNILYDASTFDTDPFEPQPGGVCTIFPFWVPVPAAQKANLTSALCLLTSGRSGYVELPYTLPQDSTLFLLLREQTPEIWLRKLDWVARHGGMALVNVHPDYLCFDDAPPNGKGYPCAHYEALLRHVKERHKGAFWNALPRDAARYIASFGPRTTAPRRRRIGMVTHSFYETDNRVIRYAEALAGRGDHVDVVALRRSGAQPTCETISGVNLCRIQHRHERSESAKLDYLLPLGRFLFAASVWLAKRHLRKRYDLIHVHNVPDFLVFSAWLPKLTGAKVILDIHDILPEFYASKFHTSPDSLGVRILRRIERLSARLADHVILANHLWLHKYVERSTDAGKCSVFINNVDTRVFHSRERLERNGKPLVLFPGGLQWHQGLDIAIRAFAKVAASLPEVEFHIYGDGNMKPELLVLTRDLGLSDRVRFFDPVPVRQIAEIMADADLGVVPKRADSFGNEAYSTKILEFMALGVPVVVSSTKIDRFYFDDSVVKFFESGDETALADAMLTMLQDKELRSRMVTQGRACVARNSWENHKGDYLNLVDALISGSRTDFYSTGSEIRGRNSEAGQPAEPLPVGTPNERQTRSADIKP